MTDAELLASLPVFVFHAALVFCRVGAAAMVMPGIGEADLPAPVRLAIALGIAVVLTPLLEPSLPSAPDAGIEVVRLIAIETALGLWIGWLARLVAIALAVAGQIIALMLGLSSALQPDPALGGQSAATARMLGLAAAALVLGTGLYAYPLRAVAESYSILPAGGALPAGAIADAFAQAASESFALAIRLSAPFVLGSVLFQAALAMLTRLAPQVQVFFVATPGQILGGLFLLAALLPAILGAWSAAVTEAFALLPGLG